MDWEEFPLFAPDGAAVEELDLSASAQRSTAYSALSHLLHDDETPEERAELLRDQGNRCFKYGDYRTALELYSRAVECKCTDDQVASMNLSNRAFAHLKLGNFGRAIEDCERARALDSSNYKAAFRQACAELELGRLEHATEHARIALEWLKVNRPELEKEISSTEHFIASVGLQQQKLDRMRQVAEDSKSQTLRAEEELQKMLESRSTVVGHYLFAQQKQCEPNGPRVVVDDSGAEPKRSLSWPVMIVYPEEFGDEELRCDIIADFHEDSTLLDGVMAISENNSELVQNIELIYRKRWTRLKDGAAATPAHVERFGEPERDPYFVGSLLGPDDVGAWVSLPLKTRLRVALGREDYITPGFPVFHMVPKGYRPK
ncbi:Tetratricopeptide repeat protein 4-like [Porphyridium purpureum]|uniref:Tetratricopeptide repeat protein 4-like n=1 Tax=Porphyridium purpureum TaxID=35688 RepID=A0A5J4Z142_PORPP|nr:Tetratricopeptide repeat protein 4-like [Porphyridium purpureum]|eukprot:POR0327..scf295_1